MLWLTPALNSIMKHLLLSVSASALRSCIMSRNNLISFESFHKRCKKCTPTQIMSYQSSILHYKTMNDMFKYCSTEHAKLLNNVVCTSRQLKFEIIKNNVTRIGLNTLSNRFYYISKLVSLDLLNLTFVHFKKIMKIQFLKNGKT